MMTKINLQVASKPHITQSCPIHRIFDRIIIYGLKIFIIFNKGLHRAGTCSTLNLIAVI